MKLMTSISSLTIAGALLCASALAQTRYCIGGSLDHLSQAQKASCTAKMQAVRAAASSLHAPDNWHFVVVCGEQGWSDYAAYTAVEGSAVQELVANTELEQHETFLRETALDLRNALAMRRVVAHELAGILLHSKDEVAINRQVDRMLGPETGQTGL